MGPLCAYVAGGGGATQASASPSFPPGLPIVPGTDLSITWPDNDNPFEAIAREGGFLDFVFIAPGTIGAGPWLPKNHFTENGALAGFGNPFDGRVGSYALQASVYNGYILELEVPGAYRSISGIESTGRFSIASSPKMKVPEGASKSE